MRVKNTREARRNIQIDIVQNFVDLQIFVIFTKKTSEIHVFIPVLNLYAYPVNNCHQSFLTVSNASCPY